jgi:hypothetical protein
MEPDMAGALVEQDVVAEVLEEASAEAYWPRITSRVQSAAGAEAWTHWLRSMQPDTSQFIRNGTVHITVATAFLKSWIQQHYQDLIAEAVRSCGFQVEHIHIQARSSMQRPPIPPTVVKTQILRIAAPSPGVVIPPAPPANEIPEGSVAIEYPDDAPIAEVLAELPQALATKGWELARTHLAKEGYYPARNVLMQLLAGQTEADQSGVDVATHFISRLPMARSILEIISKDRNQNLNEVRGKSRCRDLVLTRHICISVMRRLTKRSLPCIAKVAGNRDHTTALYACTKVEGRMASEPSFRRSILALEFEIDKLAWLQGKPAFKDAPPVEIVEDEALLDETVDTLVIPVAANDDIVAPMTEIILGGRPYIKPVQTDMFAFFSEGPAALNG